MGRTTRFVSIAVLALGLSAAVAAPAFAGNSGNKAQLTLTCDGESHDVTIAVNGDWSPARDNDSTAVYHPTAFGEVTRTFYPADGSSPQTETAPAHEFKAEQQSGHPRFDCTFVFEFSDSSGRYVDSGTVSGWIS